MISNPQTVTEIHICERSCIHKGTLSSNYELSHESALCPSVRLIRCTRPGDAETQIYSALIIHDNG